MRTMHRLAVAATAALACLTVSGAGAQPYPAKPVKIIVGGAAGSPGDLFARIVGQRLQDTLGQPFVIENRPGANYGIATETVAKSAPDGYTLLFTASPHTINPSLVPNLTWDPVRDFAPVTLVADTPLVLVTYPGVPAKTVSELVALAKAQPGKLNFGSAGNGSTLHLAGEMLNIMAGVRILHVPYKSSPGAMNDLVGGHLSLIFSGAPAALPLVKSGKLRALATTGATRSAAAPDLPTVAEAGLPGFQISAWYGMLAPAGTPAAAVNALHRETVKALRTPEFKARWTDLGADVVYNNSPDDYTAFLKSDVARWAKIIKQANIKAD